MKYILCITLENANIVFKRTKKITLSKQKTCIDYLKHITCNIHDNFTEKNVKAQQ